MNKWLERAVGWDTFIQVAIILVCMIAGLGMIIAAAFE